MAANYLKSLEASEQLADDAWKEIYDVYEEARRQLQNEVDALIARFGSNNTLSNEQANKILYGDEFTKWRMSLRKYVEKIKDMPEDNSLLLELNTLAMKSRISVKEQMMADISKAMIEVAQKQSVITSETLLKVYEEGFYRNCWDVQTEFNYGFSIAKLDRKAVQEIINYPWATKTFSKGIWDDIEKMTATLKKDLAIGISKGSSIQKMAKVMNDQFGSGRYAAERLIRTESKHFHMQSQLDSFQQLGFDEYLFHKNGTCYRTRKGVKICDCETLDDGKPKKIAEAVPGHNIPPIHPNCRCYITAKRKLNMFENKEGITPLKENIKFQQWKDTYVK